MNEKTKFVFSGWLKLTKQEKQEFEKAIREYAIFPGWRQEEIEGSIQESVNLGPIDNPTCPCCGR